MAALFGDQDEIAVFAEDLHVSAGDQELVVNPHDRESRAGDKLGEGVWYPSIMRLLRFQSKITAMVAQIVKTEHNPLCSNARIASKW